MEVFSQSPFPNGGHGRDQGPLATDLIFSSLLLLGYFKIKGFWWEGEGALRLGCYGH